MHCARRYSNRFLFGHGFDSRQLHQNKSTRRTPAGVFVLVLRELLRSRTGRQYRSTSPMADAERVLHHSAPAVVNPALPHRMGRAGTLVGGHLHKLAVHLFHAGQLQYAVKSGHKNTTAQNLHALNTLGGDLPVSQGVSFGIALFFSDCKALATAAVRFLFRRLQKYF